MRKSVEIILSKEEQEKLEATVRSSRSQVRDVFRSKIILACSQGKANDAIAREIKTNTHTVAKWRRRFAKDRFSGLKDKYGRGRKKLYGETKVEEIIQTTLQSTPINATHWSIRTMGENAGVSHTTVRRIWNAHQIKPHLVRTFKLSKDKHFVDKLRDVVGLYINPPEHAVVLSVDEKSQIQALDRTQPGLPLKKGRCGTMTHDYKRHGTTTLFAALNILDGKVIGTCMKRHRHQEYLKFLRQIDRQTSKKFDVHLVVDNYSTHKHQKVKQWLAKHPRFSIHYIPTASSWLNLVERFFREITEKRIRRGVFHSVKELEEAICQYLEHNNQKPKPFIWTKTADEILAKLTPIYENFNNGI